MANKFNALITVGVLLLSLNAHPYPALRGPKFMNASNVEVDLYVVIDSEKIKVLTRFPSRKLYGAVYEMKPQSIVVVAGDREYKLSDSEYLAQSKGMVQAQQLWTFDGNQVCVKNTEKENIDDRSLVC